MTRSKDLVLQELARENTRLTELERTRDEARTKIESLRSELAATCIATPISLPPPFASEGKAPSTPTDKVKLFRSLFRGREDILPIRFVSKKTGKPGYAPACSNKWEPGLCLLKTGGKCSDCMNQAFDPVGDQVVLDHLQGRHVIGACTLLEDETCWFLAVDFDKNSWTEDVAAFAETCRSVGVEHYINSSRNAVKTSSSLEGWCVRMPPHPSLPTVDLHMPHAGIDTELVGIGNLRRGSARLISH